MIQRVQTLYLLLITALSIFMFSGSLFNCTDETGQAIRILLSGSLTDTAGQSFAKVKPFWPVIACLVILATGSAAAIFLYKNRKLQILIAASLILVAAGLIAALVLYGSTVSNSYKLVIHTGVKSVIPVVMLMLTFLATLSIRKDDRIVKSYERLR
jgi:hypothetical protein